jgi:uncharacterized protein (TIGR00369 family)
VTPRQLEEANPRVDRPKFVPFNGAMAEPPPNWVKQAARLMGLTPYIEGIGGEVLEIGREHALARLPYGPHLVGDPDSGVVHGGVITGLLDHTSGMAVMGALREPMPIATLDLRIDYMKPATPGEAIVAECHCVKVTHEIAFVRGSAYHGDASDPIALCTGAFILMRGAPSQIPAKA